MTIGLVLALLAISLACCITAYRITAIERGWSFGSIYATDRPTFIAMACIVLALVRIVFGAVNDHFGWWTLLLALPAWFVGSPVIINSLKEKTGPVALIGAPIAVIAASFVQ
jgi:phosphatidylglycerophosphate synthase